MAHLSDGTCVAGLAYMYFLCIDGNWTLDYRSVRYTNAPLDQIYCYSSDESNKTSFLILSFYAALQRIFHVAEKYKPWFYMVWPKKDGEQKREEGESGHEISVSLTFTRYFLFPTL